MLESRIAFSVDAEPRSQGSMTAVYNRKLGVARVRHVNAPALQLWRSQLRMAARMEGASEWEGPIGIRLSFGLFAPQRTGHGYPKRPDLDKLVRAVLDALTGVCWVDDSQVVTIEAEKVWRANTKVEVWRIERKQANAPDAQTSIWQENAEGMEPYPETGYRKG